MVAFKMQLTSQNVKTVEGRDGAVIIGVDEAVWTGSDRETVHAWPKVTHQVLITVSKILKWRI